MLQKSEFRVAIRMIRYEQPIDIEYGPFVQISNENKFPFLRLRRPWESRKIDHNKGIHSCVFLRNIGGCTVVYNSTLQPCMYQKRLVLILGGHAKSAQLCISHFLSS